MTKQEVHDRIELLKKKILEANKAYFLDNVEIVPEEVRDSLKRELINLENEYPEFISSDSPTQRVWMPIEWFLPKIQHSKKKESLSDVFSFTEIEEWLERVGKDLPWDYKIAEDVVRLWFVCELKIDGLNISLIYENWKFIRAITRGDWFIWEDVTSNIKTILEIPLSLEFLIGDSNATSNNSEIHFNNFEVSWEVFMSKMAFSEVLKNEWEIFKNPRNCASWTLRQLDPAIVANRHLSFFSYEINLELSNETQFFKLETLKNLSFPVENHWKLCSSIPEIKDFIEEWTKKRTDLPYYIDWIVIKLNDINLQKRLWSTAKSPRWAVAYKFPARLAQSQVLDIILQVWRTGVITPVALLNPVLLEWSTVSRATLHNFDEIERLDVHIGDTVIIEKAWDIIPKVCSVIKDMRIPDSKSFDIPKHCPECGSNIIKNEWEVAIRCMNQNCWSQHCQKLIHFVSRKALNIEDLWDKLIELLIENKMIEDFSDFFTLTFWDFYSLPLFKEKKANNIIENIHKSKNPFLSKFLFWLWIIHVWEETSELLAKLISQNIKSESLEIKQKEDQVSLFDLWDSGSKSTSLIVCRPMQIVDFVLNNKAQIDFQEWFWVKVIESIYDYFENEKNIKVLSKLEKAWVLPQIEHVSKLDQNLEWKTFVLTWALPTLSRDDAKLKIKERWWNVSSSISKNTDYLLLWDEAWEKLEKAKRLWVRIISEEEFLSMIK